MSYEEFLEALKDTGYYDEYTGYDADHDLSNGFSSSDPVQVATFKQLLEDYGFTPTEKLSGSMDYIILPS
ncbi:MAG: hypothetical protein PUC99_06970 [Eubacteriales bacterium]|nr:hypothetical protein [Eubacteriales bacterium]